MITATVQERQAALQARQELDLLASLATQPERPAHWPDNLLRLEETEWRTGAGTPWLRYVILCPRCGTVNPNVRPGGNLVSCEASAITLAAKPCEGCLTPEERAARKRVCAEIAEACRRSEEAGR